MTFVMVEGVSGTWFYHLRRLGESTGSPALCGARVMDTQVPLSTWGHAGHLGERYCKQCATIRASTTKEEQDNGE